ncbi:MAG: GNAT family N-acetyltransferase [Chitinophagaceae bacterium]
MEIRRINNSESELVVNLFDKYRIFYKKSPDIDLARNFIRERLANNESIIFVALEKQGDQEIPVGFTQLYPTYSSVRAVKNWILNDLYVESDQRKKGIGENLIKAAIAFAKDNGAAYVQLETAIDNHTAQSLYETIGFKKQKPDDSYFVYRIDVDRQ